MGRQFFKHLLMLMVLILASSMPSYAVDNLCFTAKEDGSKVSFGRAASFTSTIKVQYRIYDTNNTSWGNWKEWTNWKEITLDTDQKIEVRCGSTGGNPNGFSINSTNYYYFKMSGNWTASGELMTLLNPSGYSAFVADYTFYKLFYGCTALTDASAMTISPAYTSFVPHCFDSMFEGCTGLVGAPTIQHNDGKSTMTLSEYCMNRMFYGCTSLKTAPDLICVDETNALSDGSMSHAMYEMFANCSNLQQGPQLINLNHQNNTSEQAFFHVFHNCNNLQFLELNYMSGETFINSLFGTNSSKGKVVLPERLKNKVFDGPETMTKTWLSPLVFTALSDNTTVTLEAVGSSLSARLLYCVFNVGEVNRYEVWLPYTPGTAITLSSAGQKVMFRARKANTYFSRSATNYYHYVVNKPVAVSGVLQSLSDITLSMTTLYDYCYYKLFEGQDITTAPTFAGSKIGRYSYANLFHNCKMLVKAPELPVTTIGEGGFHAMFSGCDKLQQAPQTLLPTSVPKNAYREMFYGCQSLTTAPDIMATTLTGIASMKQMFASCTSLKKSPELRATTPSDSCYAEMFQDCSSLKGIDVYFTSWRAAKGFTTDWVKNVAASGTFNAPLQLDRTAGDSYVPTGWDASLKTGQLCFTAQEAGSTVTFAAPKGTPAFTVSLLYSTDGSNWNAYTIGTPITLPTVGSKVYFSAASQNAQFCNRKQLYYGFQMTGKIAASGNVMSLLDYRMELKTVPDYGFCNLFRDCSALTAAPDMPATAIGKSGCSYMYASCTGLTTVPKLPATSVGDNGCEYMFSGCTAITEAPALSATNLGNNACWYMFEGCTSLTHAPTVLPATTLSQYCYAYMFRRCTSLRNMPQLPATELQSHCYYDMFSDCESLTEVSPLNAGTLSPYCYSSMFYRCRSLTTAPIIRAYALAEKAMEYMFAGCIKLNSVAVAFADWDTTESATTNWLSSVAASGAISCLFTLDCNTRDASTVPSGWTVNAKTPLCITARWPDCDIKLASRENAPMVKLLYSNDAITWKPYTVNTEIILPDEGDKVYFTSDVVNERYGKEFSGYYSFKSELSVDVSGNIMSLLDNTMTQTSVPAYAFYCLFESLRNPTAPELPATELAPHCYHHMFRNCEYLANPPKLPATSLASGCYYGMFSNCRAITTPPELPAMELADGCYQNMFCGCSELNKAPILPATALKDCCYDHMFAYCTSLTEAPLLPAKNGCSDSYGGMFTDCTSLKRVEMNLLSNVFYTCCGMLDNISTNGTLIVSEDFSEELSEYNIKPDTWTLKMIVRGDINGDDGANVTDIATFIDHLKSQTTQTLDIKAADVNKDDLINFDDLKSLSDKILQKQ